MRRGFTFLEVLFVVVIISVIFVALSGYLYTVHNSWIKVDRKTELVQICRVGLDKIIRELRQAHSISDRSTTTDLVFTDRNGNFMEIFLDIGNNELEYGFYGSAAVLISPIESGSIFAYYKRDGVTAAGTLSEAEVVDVILIISDEESEVGNLTVSSRVQLRMENDWPSYKRNLVGSSFTDEVVDPNQFDSNYGWTSAELPDKVEKNSVVVVDDVVYVGCSDNKVYALDAGDGIQIWASSALNDKIKCTPCVDENYVYTAAGDYAYALNKSDGTTAWTSAQFDNSVDNSAAVTYDGCVYFAANKYLYKLDASDGSIIWQSIELDGNAKNSSPVISGSSIFIGAGKSLQAILISDGTESWGGESSGYNLEYVADSRNDSGHDKKMEFDIENTSGNGIDITSLNIEYDGGYTYTKVKWGDDTIWEGTNSSGDTAVFDESKEIEDEEILTVKLETFSSEIDETEFSVTFSDGSVVDIPLEGGTAAGGEFDTTPVIYGGVIYIGSDDKKVYAFDESDGSSVWTTSNLADKVEGSPAISADGTALYVGAEDKVYRLDTSDGTTDWISSALDDKVKSALAVSGNYVFVSAGEYLYALDTSDGSIDWTSTQFGDKTEYSSPAISSGLVFVGCKDKYVYAFGL
ncbi:MAG: PQQ-binding-like beta-propeller repeat protein [Candidatus Omnitrophota bacterium]